MTRYNTKPTQRQKCIGSRCYHRCMDTGTVTTDIPGRLDALRWSRFHSLLIAALGTSWIIDGLEVTLGGISGPVVFGRLIASGSRSEVFTDYVLGGGLMLAAARVSAFFAVSAERRGLESLAAPLSAPKPGGV